MDEETFWYICRNQHRWREDYKVKSQFRDEVRKIINRKQRGKGGLHLKENILADLKKTLFPNEVDITENPVGSGLYSIRFLDELHLIDRGKK